MLKYETSNSDIFNPTSNSNPRREGNGNNTGTEAGIGWNWISRSFDKSSGNVVENRWYDRGNKLFNCIGKLQRQKGENRYFMAVVRGTIRNHEDSRLIEDEWIRKIFRYWKLWNCEKKLNFMHREIRRIVCFKKIIHILIFYRHLESCEWI